MKAMHSATGGDSRRGNALRAWSYCVKVLTPMIPLPRDFRDFLRSGRSSAGIEARFRVSGEFAKAMETGWDERHRRACAEWSGDGAAPEPTHAAILKIYWVAE